MARVALLVDQTHNRRQLAACLAPEHEMAVVGRDDELPAAFDLGIVDAPALLRFWDQIRDRKRAEQPVMLPFLFITPRSDLGITSGDLREVVDDVLLVPAHKIEVVARVEILLTARRLAAELAQRNDDLQTLVHALSHDLRAPARIAAGFARALDEDYGAQLDAPARHYIDRIIAASDRMQALLNVLRDFVQLGRVGVHLQPVALGPLVGRAMADQREVIVAARAAVTAAGPLPAVMADPELLRLALGNLLSNALKFVEPGVTPQIIITTRTEHGGCRIEVQDNGIGVPAEAQSRIFDTFVRLHGEERFEGTGLGLAVARKVVDLMAGRIGVLSAPPHGSVFWIELPYAPEAASVSDGAPTAS